MQYVGGVLNEGLSSSVNADQDYFARLTFVIRERLDEIGQLLLGCRLQAMEVIHHYHPYVAH
jgi:hypothetical protein